MTAVRRRLFFALWPDEPLRPRLAEAAAAVLGPRDARRRLVAANRYHVTLQFLGDTEADDEQLQRAAARVAGFRFELQIDCAGSFRTRQTVSWLGCSRTPPELLELWRQLGHSLRAEGIALPPSEHFVPHVTIARGGAVPSPAATVAPIRWPVDAFALVQSEQQPVSRYRPLRFWPLR